MPHPQLLTHFAEKASATAESINLPIHAHKPFKRLRQPPRTGTNYKAKPKAGSAAERRGERQLLRTPIAPAGATAGTGAHGNSGSGPRPDPPPAAPPQPRRPRTATARRPTARHQERVPARCPRRGPDEGRTRGRPPPGPARPLAGKAPPNSSPPPRPGRLPVPVEAHPPHSSRAEAALTGAAL